MLMALKRQPENETPEKEIKTQPIRTSLIVRRTTNRRINDEYSLIRTQRCKRNRRRHEYLD